MVKRIFVVYILCCLKRGGIYPVRSVILQLPEVKHYCLLALNSIN